MNRLVIVAAGGLAREVVAALSGNTYFDQVVLVDDDPARWGKFIGGHAVVGGTDLVPELEDHQVVVAAGRGATRRRIVRRLLGAGLAPERFTRVIDPSVVVPPGCVIGAGSIVLAGAVLTADVRVGDHVVLMPQVALTHDVVVEDYVTLCSGVCLGGGVHVGSGAYLGMNASVREKVRVGPDSTLGMGGVLLEPLPPRETWVGVPAHRVGTVMEAGESA